MGGFFRRMGVIFLRGKGGGYCLGLKGKGDREEERGRIFSVCGSYFSKG